MKRKSINNLDIGNLFMNDESLGNWNCKYYLSNCNCGM